jgi:hypothetical protein
MTWRNKVQGVVVVLVLAAIAIAAAAMWIDASDTVGTFADWGW